MHARDPKTTASTFADATLDVAAPPAPDALRSALAQVLASPLFARSPCMRRLLHFLVEASIDGQGVRPNEYRIGVEALGKNPQTYSPTDDPSVRVQIGRLRARLERYYDGDGKADPLRLEIPNGQYTVRIRRTDPPAATAPQGRQTLLVSALQELAGSQDGAGFALGLREELVHRLHGELDGLAIVSPGAWRAAEPPAPAPAYRLEGSVRHARGIARASLRLIDQHSECVLWCGRFDHPCDADVLQAQEALSHAICAGLRRHAFAAPPDQALSDSG